MPNVKNVNLVPVPYQIRINVIGPSNFSEMLKSKKERSNNYKVLSTNVECPTQPFESKTSQRQMNCNMTNFHSSIHRRGMSRQGTNHQHIPSSDHTGNRRVGNGEEEAELHNHSEVN